MRVLMGLAFVGFSCAILADEMQVSPENQVRQYNYSMKLDIARVISLSEVPKVCAVVPAQMIYEDHQGQRHTLEYRVMGDGCSGG